MRTTSGSSASRPRVGLVILALSLPGCVTHHPADRERSSPAAVDEGVRRMAEGIARDLADDGPGAWSNYFLDSPEFFMVSDGRMVFPDIETARAQIDDLEREIAEMKLAWDEIRVEPIGDGMAVMAASYRETLRETTGRERRFAGYFTGLAVETASGWKLRNAHWSRPVPNE